PIEKTFQGKKFLIGHGDGLGPGDYGYKRMKKIFTNPIAQFLFRWLHPDIGIPLGLYLSKRSRYGNKNGKIAPEIFLGEEKEWLVQYCKRKLQTAHFDYFVFGHRHLPIHMPVGNNSTYINLGDWLVYNTYAVFDGVNIHLKRYQP
ncbi:MAG: UDP-2,3-diacylglucosamine diphosphatase, partial [Chitinophagales bacterium]|nr:UDP-2,3-diacylglucosamine diphosphatase [Chitinophagales bacterium]